MNQGSTPHIDTETFKQVGAAFSQLDLLDPLKNEVADDVLAVERIIADVRTYRYLPNCTTPEETAAELQRINDTIASLAEKLVIKQD